MKVRAGAFVASIVLLGAAQLSGCHKNATTDAEMTADAGPLALAVTANPNSVLSAVATVRASVPLASLSVTVQTPGSAEEITPAVSVPSVSNAVVIPVVPLKADTTYTLQAAATDETGARLSSAPVTFTTGELPAGVPFFTVADGGTPSPGYTLVARIPATTATPDYVTIVDGTGAPVWYYVPPGSLVGDFQQQPDGTFTLAINEPVGTLAGVVSAYTLEQIDVMGDELKAWIAVEDPDAGPPPVELVGTNNHELRLQPNGDALLYAFTEQIMDFTAYGGKSDAVVIGDALERVTASGEVTFFWNAFDYVTPADADPVATNLASPEVDLTHANSVDVMDDGNYLVSLRNYSQVLKIDSTTGAVIWRLGGANGDFTFLNDPLLTFSCQHGAREFPNGDILLFDDGDGHVPPQSRAAEYQLDTTASPMTATLVWSAEDDPPLYTYVMGYAQRLSNGNTLVTYGTTMVAQEVNDAGTVLWDLSDVDGGDDFYRAYRLDTLSPQALEPAD